MLGLLTIAVQGMTAQEAQPIKPCVVTVPCVVETPSASKNSSASKQTAPSRKRASSHKGKPVQKPALAAAPASATNRVSETIIDAKLPDDPAIEKMLAPYSVKVRALEVVIGKLETELKKGSVGGGNLGNFVTDGIRAQSSSKLGKPILLAITNSGGLRKNTIAPGDLKAADIFELLPFENALIELDLTGEQLLRLLSVIVSSGDAFSGARAKYRMNANKPELISVSLLDSQGRETEINPKETYSVVTIDYLLKLGSGRYSILQEGKNVTPLNLTIRDAIMDYVKAETAAGRSIKAELDDRFVLVGPDAPKPESQQR